MTPAELQAYLHERIPLSHAMAVSVIAVEDDEVVLEAPLAPNINHRDTVFGGSAASLATLAAWCLLHARLGGRARLVIQHQTMAFHQPITGTFRARAELDEPQAWERFERALARKGRARMTVSAVLEYDEEIVGRFSGDFVALPEEASESQAPEIQAKEPQAEEAQAEETQAEETQAEETQAEETQAEEAQAEETQAEEAQAEETQAEETQAEETQAEEAQAEEPPAEERQAPESRTSESGTRAGGGDEPASAQKSSTHKSGFAFRIGGEPRRQQPTHAIPDFVRRAIDARKLMPAFEARPADQRDEYLAWITGAEKSVTQGRRLNQMLDELERGDRFMSATWRPEKSRRRAKETQAGETPTRETPTRETPTRETPTRETPAKETPAKETPAKETPAKETPAKETPAKETPTKETPAKETPAKETPAKETPAKETQAKETQAKETQAKERQAPESRTSESGTPASAGDEPVSAQKSSTQKSGFAFRIGGEPRRQQPTHAMPQFVRRAIDARKLMPAFEARPAEQREEYLAWITGVEKSATQGRRLNQMLDELERGDRFMSATWRPEKSRRR